MKLFQIVTPLSLFSTAALLAVLSSPLLADNRHDDRGLRFNSGKSDSSWNRSWSNRSNNRNADRNRDYDNRGHRQPDIRSNYRPDRHNDSWSISVNLGNRYPSRTNRGYNSSYNSLYNYGYSPGYNSSFIYGNVFNNRTLDRAWRRSIPVRSHTTIIYKQPTSVVYVNDARSGVVNSRSASATGLLRDINGNCFERTYDSQGRQIRIRMPDSACRF